MAKFQLLTNEFAIDDRSKSAPTVNAQHTIFGCYQVNLLADVDIAVAIIKQQQKIAILLVSIYMYKDIFI